MDDKKEIGKKIWELFSKNYTYSQIAKKLNISKSVVSNVINYSLPAKDWIQEDIKKLKTKCEDDKQYIRTIYKNKLKKCEKDWEDEVNELVDECEEEKKELVTEFSVMTGAFVMFFSIILIFILHNFDFLPDKKFIFLGVTLAIGSILGLISFFISKFINNKTLENE